MPHWCPRWKFKVRSLSCVSEGHVRGSSREEQNWRVYDKRYWLGDTLGGRLTFALKHEPLDLQALKRILEKAGPNFISPILLIPCYISSMLESDNLSCQFELRNASGDKAKEARG